VTPAGAANTNVSGTASLAGTAQANIASATHKSYEILRSAGLGGSTFNTLVSTNPNFSGSLAYIATDVFLTLTANLGAGSNLNQNQQNVANALNNVFNSGGTLPPVFAGLFGLTGGNLANALSQLDGEAATGAERAAFQLTNEFLNLMLDPFVNGRGNVGGLGGSAIGFAPEERVSLPEDVALAYASILNKAPVLQPFEQRWTAWGSGFGGSNRTNGDPTVGSSNVTASIFGFAGGMDYHVSPSTVVGFALAGAGTNWGLANALGTGRSDCVPGRWLWHLLVRPRLCGRRDRLHQSLVHDRPHGARRSAHREFPGPKLWRAARKRLPLRGATDGVGHGAGR
jgi:hypothetical protein